MFAGAETDQVSIAKLEALSKSELANSITLLTLSPIIQRPCAHYQMCRQDFLGIFSSSRLRHIQHHTLLPEHLDEASVNGELEYIPWRGLTASRNGFARNTPLHDQAKPYFNKLQFCFRSYNLESFAMPLRGNSTSFYAIRWDFMSFNPYFSAPLRRLSINISIPNEDKPVFSQWIYLCRNLEYLEIAMCRPAGRLEGTRTFQQFVGPVGIFDIGRPVPKLKELRLTGDTSFIIDAPELVRGLTLFPTMKRLALAHFQLDILAWGGVFEELSHSYCGLRLDELWLLNLTH